jgi:hypothetical protein
MAGTYNDITAEQLSNATPDYIKAQGTDALPQLLMILGDVLPVVIQPALNALQKELIEKYQNTNTCPDPATLQQLINKRNNIVSSLNRVGKVINITTVTLTGISTALSILQGANNSIDASKIAARIAAALNPALAAALPSVLASLDTAKLSLNLDAEWQSRIKKYKTIASAASLALSIINLFVLAAIEALNSIDFNLLKCDPNATLDPISDEIKTLSVSQAKASQTINEVTYQGFIIEIEEVPFSDTVTRRKAVGKNAQGITLIETELSFTTVPQVLISELKLIIDRDNLKAY